MIKHRAIFLDRDGTINIDKKYLHKIQDFEFLPGVVDALKQAQEKGYHLIVVTNQSGIARGYYTEQDFLTLNDWMLDELAKRKVHIDRVYYCPHHPNGVIEKYRVKCNCRKPGIELFMKAARDFNLDLDSCFAVGDRIRDLCICESTDAAGFLIGENEDKDLIQKVKVGKLRKVRYAKDLLQAVHIILQQK